MVGIGGYQGLLYPYQGGVLYYQPRESTSIKVPYPPPLGVPLPLTPYRMGVPLYGVVGIQGLLSIGYLGGGRCRATVVIPYQGVPVPTQAVS